MNKMKITKQTKKDILFFTGAFFCLLFLVWKSKFGTGAYDEPFYLTIPHRIVNGDGMFSEEWNFGQFSSFLMLPAMKLYLLLTGGTEGIILHFRYIYIMFQFLCSIVVYIRLRNKEFSFAAAWMFLLFCPYDIMAVSYNTMGVAFMTLTGVLLATAGEKEGKVWFFAGLLFAGAVLCNPFLVLLYVLYTVLVFAMKRWREKEENVSIHAWGMMTAGAALLAALFVTVVISGSSIGDLMENIPLLMNDPEHTSRSLFMIIKVYLLSFWNVYGWFIPVWAILLLLSFFSKKEEKKRKICFCLWSLSTVLSILEFLPTIQNSYNFIMVPVAVCGLGVYVITENKDKRTFYFLYLFGLLYTFLANYASNQGMHAISMAMVPTDVAAVLFIGRFVTQEWKCQNRNPGNILTVTAAVILLVAQLGMQVTAKAVHTFWEEPVWKLDTVISEGPLKGTVTTKEKAEEYERMLEDIRTHITKEGPVLFVTKETWCYLYADMEYGTFSSYLSGGLMEAFERWKLYYEVHPEKIPYYIYIPFEEDSDWESQIRQQAKEYGYDMVESEKAYHLYKKCIKN